MLSCCAVRNHLGAHPWVCFDAFRKAQRNIWWLSREQGRGQNIKAHLVPLLPFLHYTTLPEYLTKKAVWRWHVCPRVFSPKSSCTKLDGCGWLTPTVFDPNKDYQNLCIGWLACSYETLNHLSCQNSKNDNLSVCEGKSQLQGVEDHKASSVLPWPSSSLSQFSSGSTSKKREQVHYACSPADKRSQ